MLSEPLGDIVHPAPCDFLVQVHVLGVMGAVLGIAERLLDAPDEEQARELMLPLIHQASRVDQALSIHLRREARVSFPLRIVSMNRSKSMMAMRGSSHSEWSGTLLQAPACKS